jgi:leucyl-tRNA synthetase
LNRVWQFLEEGRELGTEGGGDGGEAEEQLRKSIHRTTKVVTEDFDRFSFNTAIARLQELINDGYRYRQNGGHDGPLLRELMETFLKLLAPMAPYIAEEQWARLGHTESIHFESWPGFDPELATEEAVTMVVQVNGKVRDTMEVPVTISEEEMKERALASDKVLSHLGGKAPMKVIARPPKLISLVASRD